MHLPLVFLVIVARFLAGDWLLQGAQHVLLKGLLLEDEAVLVPNEVRGLHVEGVALHAAFEKGEDVAVVGVRGEGQGAAVLHKLLELGGLVQAELVYGDLFLLALNVVVLLVLRAAGEALPGQRAAQKVEQHVADGLQVVASGLLVADVRVERGVAGGAGQVLTFFEGDVLAL